jgi:hypothetical protein
VYRVQPGVRGHGCDERARGREDPSVEDPGDGGVAPARIDASKMTNGKVEMTRPLCAYPQVARYKGTGSTTDATNFSCAQ